MLFAQALKEGVVGPDWTGKSYTYKKGEQRLITESNKGYYILNNSVFSIIDNQALGSASQTSDLPDRTADRGLRNIGGHMVYPNGGQGGGNTQYWVRHLVQIFDDVKQGEVCWLAIPKCGTYQEGNVGSGTPTLNNVPMQVGVQYPPVGGQLTACQFDADPELKLTKAYAAKLTKTFDTDTDDELVRWVAHSDIRAGSHVHVHMWMKNTIMVSPSGDLRRKLLAGAGAAGTFMGDMMVRTTDAPSYNSNSMALFDDTDAGIVGMSAATRDALTNTGTQVSGAYWHTGIVAFLKDTDLVSLLDISDSTGQRGGSANSQVTDDSLTYGHTGRLFGRRFAVIPTGASNEASFRWVDNPGNSAVRRKRAGWCTHIVIAEGRNVIPSFSTEASIPTMLSKLEEFTNIPEFEDKPFVFLTLGPQGSAAATPSGAYGTDLASSPSATNPLTRAAYNEFWKNHPRTKWIFDVDKLMSSNINSNKMRVLKSARTAVVTIAPGTAIAESATEIFRPSDEGLRVGSPNFDAIANVTGAHIRTIKRYISPFKVELNAIVTPGMTTQNMYIGALPWTSSGTDWIHLSDLYYNLLYSFNITGLFSEGIDVFIPEIGANA